MSFMASIVLSRDLHSNGIKGKLESTARLPDSLRYLDLRDNKIRGSIPNSIGTLTGLRSEKTTRHPPIHRAGK